MHRLLRIKSRLATPEHHPPSLQAMAYWDSYIPPGFSWWWQGAFAQYYYTTTTECSNTGDTDYVFYFAWNSSNYNALRWATNIAHSRRCCCRTMSAVVGVD